MPAAERRWLFPAGVAALVLGALGLRLWGFRHGPAVRLQRRRERALRGGRDRHVRAHLQPELLHQPAGLHVPAARRVPARLRRPRRRLRLLRGRPEQRVRARAGAVGRARARSRSGCWRGRARGCSTAASASSPPRCWRWRSCPSTTPTSRSTTCRRWRRCASRSPASGASSRAGGCSTTRSPASGWGSPARRSTPAGSCCCRCSPRRWSAATRASRSGSAGSRSRACSRSSRS